VVGSVQPVSRIILEKKKKNRRVITARTFLLCILFSPLTLALLSLYVHRSKELRAIIFTTHECHLVWSGLVCLGPSWASWVPRYLLVPCTAAIDVCPFGLLYISPMIEWWWWWWWFFGAIGGMNLAGETEILGGNLPRRHFVHHKIPHDRPGFEPRTAPVGSQRLTAWAMARPLMSVTYSVLLLGDAG
jgi:hypothetical protein